MEHDRRRTDRHGLHGQVPCARLDGRAGGFRRRAGRAARRAVRGRGGPRAPARRRIRLRGLDRRLAGAGRRPGGRRRLDHDAKRLHAPMAIAALEAGKHVWCEKPMAPALADAERMAAAARAAGRVAILGYNYIQSPAIRYIGKLLKSGAIGPAHPFPPRDGRGLYGRRRGAVLLAQRGEAPAMARSTISPSTR